MEDILERVLFLSLAAFGLCVLILGIMMIVGRWRHNLRERRKNRPRKP